MNISRKLLYSGRFRILRMYLFSLSLREIRIIYANHLPFLVDGNQIYRYNVTKDKRITMQEDI